MTTLSNGSSRNGSTSHNGHNRLAGLTAAHPHSKEAEKAVLGSILREGPVLSSVRAILRPRDFWEDAHQQIYMAMLALADAGEPIDLGTVAGWLADRGGLIREKL